MKPYEEEFPVGSEVTIASYAVLEQFLKSWKFHNPLKLEQLEFAGKEAKVAKVGFYHGGDPLYVLDGIPGIWHEQCLTRNAES
jgi:hypothetical protein